MIRLRVKPLYLKKICSATIDNFSQYYSLKKSFYWYAAQVVDWECLVP